MEDEGTNEWGVEYVVAGNSSTSSGRTQGSTMNFEKLCSQAVPGYKLEQTFWCGSLANEYAIGLVTGNDFSQVAFGMGSYVGGMPTTQKYSSTGFAR